MMIKRMVVVFAALFMAGAVCASGSSSSKISKADPNAKAFGVKLDKSKPTYTLSTLISGFSKYKGKTVLVSGKIEKVCKLKGCWINLKDGDNVVMARFKDHGFSVPKGILGKKVLCQGVLSEKMQSVAEQKHLAKDAGKTVAKNLKPKKVFSFLAVGVQVL